MMVFYNNPSVIPPPGSPEPCTSQSAPRGRVVPLLIYVPLGELPTVPCSVPRLLGLVHGLRREVRAEVLKDGEVRLGNGKVGIPVSEVRLSRKEVVDALRVPTSELVDGTEQHAPLFLRVIWAMPLHE